MEAIAICLGLTPFVAGRTTLTVGLVALWYVLGKARTEGGFTLTSLLTAVPMALLIVGIGYLAELARRPLGELFSASPEVKRRGDQTIAMLAAVLLSQLVLSTTDAAPTAALVAAAPDVLTAGFGDRAAILLGVGLLALLFAGVRSRIAEAFDSIPLSSEGGVLRALFWAESAFTLVGIAIAIAFPVVGAVMAAGLLLSLLVLLRVLKRLTGGRRAPCPHCAKSVHLAASVCPGCSGALTPRAVGAFGRVLATAPTDAARHRLALLSGQSCPRCAERLAPSNGAVACSACHQRPFLDADEARAFVRHVDTRVAAMTPLYAALGLVPILGLAVSLVLYRLSPAGALASYVAWHQRLAPRLMRGAAVVALSLVQPLPLIGAGATVAVVGATQLWTRRAFLATTAP